MIRLSGTAEEKLRHGEACPQTFAEHGPRHADTTNTMPPGLKPGAASLRASRGDRPGALAQGPGLAPLVRTKQRKNPFSAGPGIKGTVLYTGAPPIDLPGFTLEPRSPQIGLSSGSPPGFEMEHLDRQALRTFIEAPPRLGRTRSPPTSLAGYPLGGRRARSGHRSMATRRMLLLRGARPRGRPRSTAADQPAGRSMRSRVEPTDSMHHAIASEPAGDDHVLKSGSRTRLAEILSMASIVVKTGRTSSSMIDAMDLSSISISISISSHLSALGERSSRRESTMDRDAPRLDAATHLAIDDFGPAIIDPMASDSSSRERRVGENRERGRRR